MWILLLRYGFALNMRYVTKYGKIVTYTYALSCRMGETGTPVVQYGTAMACTSLSCSVVTCSSSWMKILYNCIHQPVPQIWQKSFRVRSIWMICQKQQYLDVSLQLVTLCNSGANFDMWFVFRFVVFNIIILSLVRPDKERYTLSLRRTKLEAARYRVRYSSTLSVASRILQEKEANNNPKIDFSKRVSARRYTDSFFPATVQPLSPPRRRSHPQLSICNDFLNKWLEYLPLDVW